MKLIGDYHSHTIYSSYPKPSQKHAKGTIRENAEAALAGGLKYLAITEHGPSHYIYGVNRKMFPKMREEIDQLNLEFEPKGLKILLGVEANIIGVDGTIDVDDEIIDQLDFLIMGYHYGATPKNLKSLHGLYGLQSFAKFTGLAKKRAERVMTKAFLRAMDRYPLDMISHPGSKAPVDIVEIGKKASEKGIALEISSKHDQLSIESIRKLKDMDIKFMLNSDAHWPKAVGNVKVGYNRAVAAGLDLTKITNIEVKD